MPTIEPIIKLRACWGRCWPAAPALLVWCWDWEAELDTGKPLGGYEQRCHADKARPQAKHFARLRNTVVTKRPWGWGYCAQQSPCSVIQPWKGMSQGSLGSWARTKAWGSTTRAGTAPHPGSARSRSYQPPPEPRRMPR